MADIRAQMKNVIQSGIDGWLDACFSGNNAPTDAITGYPLTRDSVVVMYHSEKPYQAIEDEFLEGVVGSVKPTSKFFQAWSNYHWNYARLELAEKFEPVQLELSEDVLNRREQIRQEFYALGYKLAGVK